ncbi:PEP-CTERM sorting domain-containing protein [Adhaeretor mobilis]|uniref:Ice-binding protein C-terminal domain-containing protein n=1 Tax=Adhaeretor mobilis TaxID=1930276 RepID=A0A517MTP4_9BACT|nr:PEP-CTERM sorting domain-containing protein [Adhaeretor mobilis]QDS98248.1 hypothetical protein HG15A2_15210 [Adhaeretor mobilis]
MKKHLTLAASAMLAVLVCQPAFAGVLYSEDFDVDNTANWTVNTGPTDGIADFFYDYSAIGVPAAPGSAGTVGLKMTANNTDGVFGGLSVSPTGESFAGDYQLSFNMWQNYVGPIGPGGSGTTQVSYAAIGTSGSSVNYPGVIDSALFATTLDGGSASDVRVYSPDATGSYAAGANYFAGKNGSDAYYNQFGSEAAPGDQLTLFPGQTGTTDSGETSFAWREVTIDVVGGVATWTIDGLPMGTIDTNGLTLGLGGSNILFGHSDTNSSTSSDPNNSLLNVTLIDNVLVTSIPEPSSLLLLSLSGVALLRRRR